MISLQRLSRQMLLGAVGVLLFSATPARANDWYRWRGPALNGISPEKGWRSEWPDEGPKQLWKAAVGLGYSSVVVSQGRLFTMGNRADIDTVYCLDATSGKEVWKHSYPCATNPRYHEGGTTSTPTVDGDVVYVLSREGDLFCFNAASGSMIWSKDIAKELKLELSEWGFAGSPLVVGDRLLLNVGTHGAAVDKLSGDLVWSTGTKPAGYASVVPMNMADHDALLIFAAKELAAVDQRNGQVLWRYPWETKYDINATDPIVAGNQIFISSGYRVGGALLKVTGTKPVQVWKTQEMHNQLNASVLIGGHLYGISGQNGYEADLRCVEFATGKVRWKEPSVGFGSLTAADGKLIVLSEKGELIIAEATPDAFKPISRAQVLGGKNWTAPVLSNGRIYCRNSQGTLVCVDVRGKGK